MHGGNRPCAIHTGTEIECHRRRGGQVSPATCGCGYAALLLDVAASSLLLVSSVHWHQRNMKTHKTSPSMLFLINVTLLLDAAGVASCLCLRKWR